MTSNSWTSRLPLPTPTSAPLSTTRYTDSTPSTRSSTLATSQPGCAKVRRYSPTGFSSGTCGGSIGNGNCTLVYQGRP